MKNNLNNAKILRKNMTSQERKLWAILRNHKFYGYEIRRQYPIGEYIVDFICRNKQIIIEVDGGQHNEEENIKSDNIRTKYLESKGYKVIRFWNNEIDSNMEGVYKKLMLAFSVEAD